MKRCGHNHLLLFAVLLPALAIFVEAVWHPCAQRFFDPLPAQSYVLLCSLVPLAGLLTWLAVRDDLSAYLASIALIHSLAVGIAMIYCIMLIPALPSLFLSGNFGLGLLLLAPYSAVCALWASRTVIDRRAAEARTFFDVAQVKHWGHLLVLATILVLELPSTATRIYLHMASDPKTSSQGMAMLRQFGSQEVMLRACYERCGRATDVLGSLYQLAQPLNTQDARNIFFLVTGKSFNSVPIPASARATVSHAALASNQLGLGPVADDDFDRDPDIAGEIVSGLSRGLSLSASEIRGSVDANAGVADLTWEFSLKNVSQFAREARATILLPCGAAVNRASLTMDGKTRDAQIMTRGWARDGYRESIVEHRDPLLVSACGPDRVLVQCFPVNSGQSVSVHLGIAAPLTPWTRSEAALQLPTFCETNFQADSPQKLSMVSTGIPSVSWTSIQTFARPGGQFTLSGEISASATVTGGATIRFARDPALLRVAHWDPFEPGQIVISEIVEQSMALKPRRLWVVLDGSISMIPYIPDVAQALQHLPRSLPTQVTLASDRVTKLRAEHSMPSDRAFSILLEGLSIAPCTSGQDNAPALLKALESACYQKDSAVLWVHGPQPQLSPASQSVRDVLSGFTNRPTLFDMQVASGPNAVLEGLLVSDGLVRVRRKGSVGQDLRTLFDQWSRRAGPLTIARKRQKAEGKRPLTWSGRTAAVSAQLAAFNQILSVLSSQPTWPPKRPVGSEEPLALASVYHLVTPVSSAVVSPADSAVALDKPTQALVHAPCVHLASSARFQTIDDSPATDSIMSYSGCVTYNRVGGRLGAPTASIVPDTRPMPFGNDALVVDARTVRSHDHIVSTPPAPSSSGQKDPRALAWLPQQEFTPWLVVAVFLLICAALALRSRVVRKPEHPDRTK